MRRRLAISVFLALAIAAQATAPPVTVYITRTGSKYHIISCRYLKKSKISIELKEAKRQGFDPCKVCKPPH